MLKTGIRSYILTNDFVFLQRLARLLTTIHRYFPYTCFLRIDWHDYTPQSRMCREMSWIPMQNNEATIFFAAHRLARLYTTIPVCVVECREFRCRIIKQLYPLLATTYTTIHHNPVCVVKCREFRCRIIKHLYPLLRNDWHDYTPQSPYVSWKVVNSDAE
jgi:hypothetical protein